MAIVLIARPIRVIVMVGGTMDTVIRVAVNGVEMAEHLDGRTVTEVHL